LTMADVLEQARARKIRGKEALDAALAAHARTAATDPRPKVRKPPPRRTRAIMARPRERCARRSTNGSSRGSPGRSDDPDPDQVARRCLGCGEPIDHLRRDAECCGKDSCHKRIQRSRTVEVCPCCGDFSQYLDDFTGWCSSCTRELQLAAV
jgi:hypothetical protein